MRGLLPRSLPSPIAYSLDLSAGSVCLLLWGELRRLSPGRLCCSSKIYLGKSGFAVVGFLLAAAYLWASMFVVPSVLG